MAIGIVLLLTVITSLLFWRSRDMSENQLSLTDALMEREDYYLLMADGDTLFAFSSFSGDTLLTGATDSTSQVERRVMRVQAQWVNRLPVIPSCRGRLMLMPADTSAFCKVSESALHSLLMRQQRHIAGEIDAVKDQQEQTAYYLRTHNVTEMGFDVVARTDKRLASALDSLKHVSQIMERVKSDTRIAVHYKARYYAFVARDTDTVRVECTPVEMRNGLLLVRTMGNEKPANLHTKLTVYDKDVITQRLKLRHAPARVLPDDMRIDSCGVYKGDMDSVKAAHGYGKLTSADWSYYEGDWHHGVRSGFGFALSPGKRLRIGEWKDDEYLGERLTYTSDRIYGIDISRYQHEKGRKRFKINWDRLAITSLGTKSRKNISGTVNYPISFIYIKSTEGKSVFNKYYYADYRAARQHGYKVGTYHFFSTKTSGANQAFHFLKKSLYRHGDFPPVLDVEPSAKQIAQMGGTNAMFVHIRKWLTMVEQAWRVKPILYVSQTFINRYMHNAPDLLKNYNVWIARYGEYKPDVNLVYWQLCPDGRVRGIQTEVDINVFNGFEPEWENFIK